MSSTVLDRTGTSPQPADGKGTARLLRSLGVASVGLGVPQIVRPGQVTRAIGVGSGSTQRALATAVGARELVSAAGLLTPRLRRHWIWTRVAGDAMDLALLGRAVARGGPSRGRTVAAGAAVAALTAVDVYAGVRARRAKQLQTLEVSAATTVRRSPQEVYAFWRRLENLPSFMGHVEDVTATSGTRSHWKVSAPFGRSVEWDAEITQDVAGERLSWRSLPGADVENEGTIRFVPAPGDRGTEVHVSLNYRVPGGALARGLARFAGEDPRQQLDDDLRRFKQVMEAGEITRSDGAPSGKRAREEFPQRPARPLTHTELTEVAR